MINFSQSNMLPLHYVEDNSRIDYRRINYLNSSSQQPVSNPHQRILSRNQDNCPKNLTNSQKNRWLKAGKKACDNQRLLESLPLFYWPEVYYKTPIFIHRGTSEYHLRGIIHKIANTRLFTIDTESNKPTKQYPYSVPALIQIQAVHDENCATVIIIEVQHLPEISTPLFVLIKEFCKTVFSTNNQFLSWGDIRNELIPFIQFNLFNISDITNVLNFQEAFTYLWNVNHPHTKQCLDQHLPSTQEPEDDNILICLVNTSDLENDFNYANQADDYNMCICPDEIRPYKVKNSIWALQKAIKFIFNQALDKSMTMNFWSCGLDPTLHTWKSNEDKITRQKLILYAINDLFATTKLYFHFNRTESFLKYGRNIHLNFIPSPLISNQPTFLIISDSHGRYIPDISNTPEYKQINKSIPGLQWNNKFDNQLSIWSLVNTSSSIFNLLASCTTVLFLIGTNSIRTTPASTIVTEIEAVITLVRQIHTQLTTKQSIVITSAFPCFRTSSLFPHTNMLTSNISSYNILLKHLSINKNFTILDVPIQNQHISNDGMHINTEFSHILHTSIERYFSNLIEKRTKPPQSQRRSREAITRRNKRRHEKLKLRRTNLNIQFAIDTIWSLRDIKLYLKHKNIKFSRILNIHNHKLLIQFNTIDHKQHATENIDDYDFDENNYRIWMSNKQV